MHFACSWLCLCSERTGGALRVDHGHVILLVIYLFCVFASKFGVESAGCLLLGFLVYHRISHVLCHGRAVEHGCWCNWWQVLANWLLLGHAMSLEGLSLNVFGSRHARVELYQSLQLWSYWRQILAWNSFVIVKLYLMLLMPWAYGHLMLMLSYITPMHDVLLSQYGTLVCRTKHQCNVVQ